MGKTEALVRGPCIGKGCDNMPPIGILRCRTCIRKLDRKLALVDVLTKPLEYYQALVCFLFGLSIGLYLGLWYH